MSVNFKILNRLLLIVLTAHSLGCGKSGSSTPSVHLQGAVMIDGEPVPANAQASITFQPSAGNKGRPVTVPIVGGKYDSPETPLGSVLAIVSLNIPTGKTVMSERMGGEVPEIKTIALSPEQAGGIKLDLTEDKLDQDFVLESAK